jgi:hypothetical protein
MNKLIHLDQRKIDRWTKAALRELSPAQQRYLDSMIWHGCTVSKARLSKITKLELSSDRLFLVGRLTLNTADGIVWREAFGTEELKEWNEKKSRSQS